MSDKSGKCCACAHGAELTGDARPQFFEIESYALLIEEQVRRAR